jgi:hypothetical protein
VQQQQPAIHMQPVVYFVGRQETTGHHAAPLMNQLNIRIATPDEVLADAKAGDLAVFYTEHFDAFRQCCIDLQAKNVATLYMIDGILEWRNAWENSPQEIACPYTMRPALAHKVACIGPSQARTIASWGNEDKVEVVGVPRLENLAEQFRTPKSDATKREGSNGPFRVLVMTAKTPAFTDQQLATVKQSLRDLAKWQTENQNLNGRPVEFIWRLTRGIDLDLGVTNQLSNFAGADLQDVLSQIDSVICTPSTAVLEAMLMGLPVAQLDYHNCPHYVQTGWDIPAADHIDAVIQELASPPQRRMLFQQSQLRDALYLSDSAVERTVQLVNQMLKTAAQQINAGQPIKFPPNMLSAPSAQHEAFNHQQLFPHEPTFDEHDMSVLQCQLAHSRREIEHLHREIEQLQSELDQAHQIFETIDSHPIAGPIVRIRQKMVDLMDKIRSRDIGKPNDRDPPPPQPF